MHFTPSLYGENSDAANSNLPFAGQRLNVFNWSDYLDPDLIAEFERRTGARVQYDNFAAESQLDAKLLTGGSGYDAVFPSDHSMVVLMQKELLAKLDKSLRGGKRERGHRSRRRRANAAHQPVQPDDPSSEPAGIADRRTPHDISERADRGLPG